VRLRSVIWTNRSGVARRGQKFCPQHFYVLQRTPLFKGPDWSCACKFKFIIFSCDSGIKQKQYLEPGGDWGDRFNRRLATEVILHTEVILCCTSLIKTHAVFCHALNTDNNLIFLVMQRSGVQLKEETLMQAVYSAEPLGRMPHAFLL